MREHYYKQIEDDNLAKRQIADQVKLCIENFMSTPRFDKIKSSQRLELQHLICRVTQSTSLRGRLFYTRLCLSIEDQIHIHVGKQVR